MVGGWCAWRRAVQVGVEEVSGPLEMHSNLGFFCEENKPCTGAFCMAVGLGAFDWCMGKKEIFRLAYACKKKPWQLTKEAIHFSHF